jgi:hypothetical protein
VPNFSYLLKKLFSYYWQLRSISDTYYSLRAIAAAAAAACTAAPAPQVDHGRSVAAGTSAHAVMLPSICSRHLFIATPVLALPFGQSIADVVGRSKKPEAQRILKAFDDSTSEAQTFMAKAVEYTSRAQELMAKAHHECFIAMQKLLVDARADKIAVNEARRRSRVRNDDSSRAHTSHAAGTTQLLI